MSEFLGEFDVSEFIDEVGEMIGADNRISYESKEEKDVVNFVFHFDFEVCESDVFVDISERYLSVRALGITREVTLPCEVDVDTVKIELRKKNLKVSLNKK
jgi:HSP20 family molecular chaperone IbpA